MENTKEKLISEIHLIRHGITEGTANRWLYGEIDIPLSNEGVDELAKLAEAKIYPCQEFAGGAEALAAASSGQAAEPDWYGEDPTPDFYTSGMLRAEQTFFLIYGTAAHQTIPELKEISFGIFEGHTHKELEGKPVYEEWLANTDLNVGPPKGESVNGFNERIQGGFQKLLGFHKVKELSHRHSKVPAHTVMVCHGGVIAAIMNQCFGTRNNDFYSWVPDPGHGYSLILEDGEVKDYRKF